MSPTTTAPSTSSSSHQNKPSRTRSIDSPTIEMVILGSGGGPLENDVSGYMVKPYSSRWEDGWVGLEGGSGIGALVAVLREEEVFGKVNGNGVHGKGKQIEGLHDEDRMFGGITWPDEIDSRVLKAGYLFSYLSCYLITHAHFDHILSLVLHTGSLPTPYTPSTSPPVTSYRKPIYAPKIVLDGIAKVYEGDVWPELGCWCGEGSSGSHSHEKRVEEGGRKRRRVGDRVMEVSNVKGKGKGDHLDPWPGVEGVGVQYCSLPQSPQYQNLPTLASTPTASPRLSVMSMPIAHGTTTKGVYPSTAYFLKLVQGEDESSGKEVLFFGDVESKIDWAKQGNGAAGSSVTRSKKRSNGQVVDLNRAVWVEAARRWDEGRLGGVFIECSYTSDRPPELMFGHLHPFSLYAELKMLASLVNQSSQPPLQGLRVFVIHVKESLSPHPSRKTPKQRVKEELYALEEEAKREGKELGVEWVMAERGMRVLI